MFRFSVCVYDTLSGRYKSQDECMYAILHACFAEFGSISSGVVQLYGACISCDASSPYDSACWVSFTCLLDSKGF